MSQSTTSCSHMERLKRHRYAFDAGWFVVTTTIGALSIGACSNDERSVPALSSGAAGMPAFAGHPAVERGGSGGTQAGNGSEPAGTAGEIQGGMAGNGGSAGAGGCTALQIDPLPPTS